MAKKIESGGDGKRTGGYCGYVRSIGGSTKAAVETAVVILAASRPSTGYWQAKLPAPGDWPFAGEACTCKGRACPALGRVDNPPLAGETACPTPAALPPGMISSVRSEEH